jgi:hypothetical protein
MVVSIGSGKAGQGDKEKGRQGDKGTSNPKIETQVGGSYE